MSQPSAEAMRFHGDAELGPGLVDLAVNVPVEPLPDWLAEPIMASMRTLHRYPDDTAAREALAARHARTPEQVLVTAGAAQAFVLVAQALRGRVRRPVVVHPQFTEPEAALVAAGHRVSRVVLPASTGFALDPSLVPDDADLVLIGNPTNPTSVLHSVAAVAGLARPGRILVVDEAFAPTSYGEPESLAHRTDLPGLVVIRSFTKVWSLAGLRIGYLLAAEELVETLRTVTPLWPVAAPALAAAVACASPRAQAAERAVAARLAARRHHLVSLLDAAGVPVVGKPSSGYVLIGLDSGEAIRLALRERGFAVRRGDTFPGLGPDWLRIAVRDTATSEAFVAALRDCLATRSVAGQHPWSTSQPLEAHVPELGRTIADIAPASAAAMDAARALQARLTKPAGSLGALEELSVRLAGLAGACPPPLPEPAALAIFAGDHGVHAQGVSPWPQEVTAQMVANFLAGGAVVNALARQVGVTVTVVDVGVASPIEPGEHLVCAKVRAGTRDLATEAALTRDEVRAALHAGIAVAEQLVDGGAAALLTGDMGIANTTPAAALIAAFTGTTPAEVTGRGTGIDDEMLLHKIAVIEQALRRHAPDPRDPIGVLAAVGGLEHAALTGFILAGAARHVPVILDGVIAASAALAAAALAPYSLDAMVAGHRSVEPGATVALDHLGLVPLIDLGLRLGEGTGAVLAMPVVAGAVRVLHEVATFDSAGVSEK